MRCEIYQDRAGSWRWRLRARNNRIIADGAEAYSERRKAVDAVQRLADVAGDLSLFEVLQTAVDAARRGR
jgi:uncharacterized protein YegP (UPF0339 family)